MLSVCQYVCLWVLLHVICSTGIHAQVTDVSIFPPLLSTADGLSGAIIGTDSIGTLYVLSGQLFGDEFTATLAEGQSQLLETVEFPSNSLTAEVACAFTQTLALCEDVANGDGIATTITNTELFAPFPVPVSSGVNGSVTSASSSGSTSSIVNATSTITSSSSLLPASLPSVTPTPTPATSSSTFSQTTFTAPPSTSTTPFFSPAPAPTTTPTSGAPLRLRQVGIYAACLISSLVSLTVFI